MDERIAQHLPAVPEMTELLAEAILSRSNQSSLRLIMVQAQQRAERMKQLSNMKHEKNAARENDRDGVPAAVSGARMQQRGSGSSQILQRKMPQHRLEGAKPEA